MYLAEQDNYNFKPKGDISLTIRTIVTLSGDLTHGIWPPICRFETMTVSTILYLLLCPFLITVGLVYGVEMVLRAMCRLVWLKWFILSHSNPFLLLIQSQGTQVCDVWGRESRLQGMPDNTR